MSVEGTVPAVVVRPVRREDLEQVWTLLVSLAEYEQMSDVLTGSAERLGEMLFGASPVLFGLVAERPGDRIVGYALYHFTWSSFRTSPRMWLEDLFVEEAVRGTGAGERLFLEFVRDAHARGCHRVDWHVLEGNPACRFYERLGARRSDAGLLQYGLDAAGMQRLVERD